MRFGISRPLVLSVTALLVLTACAGGDEGAAADGAGDEVAQAGAEAPDDGGEGPDTGDDGDAAPAGGGGRGMATITFDTGDVLSTEVLCGLEPQVAAGQEILYTATSLRSPYFDLTVFGEDAAMAGASVSWDETEDFETYEESWSAGVMGDFDAELDGTTITGSGTFTRNEDASGNEGETRQGEVEVVCDP